MQNGNSINSTAQRQTVLSRLTGVTLVAPEKCLDKSGNQIRIGDAVHNTDSTENAGGRVIAIAGPAILYVGGPDGDEFQAGYASQHYIVARGNLD